MVGYPFQLSSHRKRVHEATADTKKRNRERASTQWAFLETELPSLKIELRTMVQELRQGNTRVDIIIASQLAAQQTMESIKLDTLQIRDTLEKTEIAHHQQLELKEFLHSFYFPTMNARRNMESIVAAEGTFLWILQDPHEMSHDDDPETALDYVYDFNLYQRLQTASRFRFWLQDPNQNMFWISGKPGSGKSALMHYLSTEVKDYIEPGALLLSAFIWTAGDELQKSLKGLLCTLVHQLLHNDEKLAQLAFGLQTAHPSTGKVSVSDWSEKELREVLTRALKSAQRPVYILIDGLDEVESSGGSPERLMDFVRSLLAHGNAKLCVSSRPEIFYEKSLQHYPHFRLQDLTRHDMWLLANRELTQSLQSLPKSDKWEHSPRAVLEHIVSHANGVFLWLRLVVRSLKTGAMNEDSWELIWERIEDLPADLESIYKRMVERLERDNKKYRDFAATIFALLMLDTHFDSRYGGLEMDSLTSITLYIDKDLRQKILRASKDSHRSFRHELRCSGEHVHKLIRARCVGLVEIPRDSFDIKWGMFRGLFPSERVTFIHRTVRDFMMDAGRDLWQGAVPTDLAGCLDVQRVGVRFYDQPMIRVGRWAPSLSVSDPDTSLLLWCNEIPEQAGNGQREVALEHLAQVMMADGAWDKDERNPCVLMVSGYPSFVPPVAWLTSWIPTGMSRADFADQLLVAALSSNQSELPWAVVHGLCDHGARPYRRRLPQWPGVNWPSAIALAAAASIGAHRNWETLANLSAMLELGVDLSEQVTVLYNPESGCATAVNRRTSTILSDKPPEDWYEGATFTLYLLQTSITVLICWAMHRMAGTTDTDIQALDSAIDRMRTPTSGIVLLGVAYVGVSKNPGWVKILSIVGGLALRNRVSLFPDALTTFGIYRRRDNFDEKFNAVLAEAKTENAWHKLSSKEAVDWMLALGLPEDTRDQYYCCLVDGAVSRRPYVKRGMTTEVID